MRGYEISIAFLKGDKGGMAEIDKISTPRRPTLGERLERNEKDRGPRWVPKTASKFRTMRALLLEVIGEATPIEEIDRALMREVRDVIQDLPPNYTKLKALAGLSAREAASKARDRKMKALSRKSVIDYTNNLSALFKFAVREEYIDRNPAERLEVSTPPEMDKRRPFTVSELNQLFLAPVFVGCVDDGDNWRLSGASKVRRGRY